MPLENQPESRSASTYSSRGTQLSKSKMIAATGLFAALSIILTSISQFPILSFPIIPYLQFDLGEVAIVLALLLFGPVPATASAFVEFITLMGFGVNAPIGPILKRIAILSSIAGLWFGIKLASKSSRLLPKRSLLLGSSLGFGVFARVAILTVANYYLVIFIYGLAGIINYVKTPFELVGISVTSSNAIFMILSFTAVFNALQLIFVFAISYLIVREPHVTKSLRSNKVAWFESLGKRVEPNQ